MAGANIKSKDSYVYFLYSEQQRAERTRVERTMSRTFNPGTVVVNGRRENFTEISKSPTNRYPDCKVVAQGIKSKMVYTPISIT
jgi:hypothetical protein